MSTTRHCLTVTRRAACRLACPRSSSCCAKVVLAVVGCRIDTTSIFTAVLCCVRLMKLGLICTAEHRSRAQPAALLTVGRTRSPTLRVWSCSAPLPLCEGQSEQETWTLSDIIVRSCTMMTGPSRPLRGKSKYTEARTLASRTALRERRELMPFLSAGHVVASHTRMS